jgi:Secretion system C-terminal sorting domain
MKKHRVLTNFVLLTLLLNFSTLFSQYIPSLERGVSSERNKSNLTGYNVQATIFNFGVAGKETGSLSESMFKWPANSGEMYIYFIQLFVGGEVVDEEGNSIQIVSIPSYRTNDDGTKKWTFQPVPGYRNSLFNGVANSVDKLSWPTIDQGGWADKYDDPDDPGWVGSWNSFLGRDNFLAQQEFYYHMSDDRYDRYEYYPDSTDLSRRGLGIVVSQRVLTLDFLPDEVFFISDIYNAGTKDLEKGVSTLWVADLIGGDSGDDIVEYDSLRQTVYFRDMDNIGLNGPFSGIASIMYLETPVNSLDLTETGVSGMVVKPAASMNINDDTHIWNSFMKPGVFEISGSYGDSDTYISNGYFNLPAGQKQRLAYAVVFAKDKKALERKNRLINSAYDAIKTGNQTMPVTLITPTKSAIVSGGAEIKWNAKNSDPDVLISLTHSKDGGKSWNMLADKLPNSGSYFWDTDEVEDGIFNKLKLIAWDQDEFNIVESDSFFTINNSEERAPQIKVSSPHKNEVISGMYPIRWMGGDADGNTVAINLFYEIDAPGQRGIIVKNLDNDGRYFWDTQLFPNSANYKIKAVITDADFVGVDSVQYFEISNARKYLDENDIIERNTIGTGKIDINIFDDSLLKNYGYLVKFHQNDLSTTYDVINSQTQDTLVRGATEVKGISEGPGFDGIRLVVKDDPLELNTGMSFWNNESVFEFDFKQFQFLDLVGIPELTDYVIEFGNVGIDTSTYFVLPLNIVSPEKPVNFNIKNLKTNKRIEFAFFEIDGNNGEFSVDGESINNSDLIVFLKRDENDSLITTWALLLNPSTGKRNPVFGDSLILKLFKPFQNNDQFYFETLITSLGDKDNLIEKFSLNQNYPNPFNMETKIQFKVSVINNVEITIYDVLGKKVKTLLNQKVAAGTHFLKWNGRNENNKDVASGLYFVHLKSGSFALTKKMLMIR